MSTNLISLKNHKGDTLIEPNHEISTFFFLFLYIATYIRYIHNSPTHIYMDTTQNTFFCLLIKEYPLFHFYSYFAIFYLLFFLMVMRFLFFIFCDSCHKIWSNFPYSTTIFECFRNYITFFLLRIFFIIIIFFYHFLHFSILLWQFLHSILSSSLLIEYKIFHSTFFFEKRFPFFTYLSIYCTLYLRYL